MRTFSLGIGESYFFLLQHFLLKIERPFKSVYHTVRNPYGIHHNNSFTHCSSWTKSIYRINNVWGVEVAFTKSFLFHKYSLEVILPTFHRWSDCLPNIPS